MPEINKESFLKKIISSTSKFSKDFDDRIRSMMSYPQESYFKFLAHQIYMGIYCGSKPTSILIDGYDNAFMESEPIKQVFSEFGRVKIPIKSILPYDLENPILHELQKESKEITIIKDPKPLQFSYILIDKWGFGHWNKTLHTSYIPERNLANAYRRFFVIDCGMNKIYKEIFNKRIEILNKDGEK